MVWHGWSVLGLRNGRRVRGGVRRAFVRRFVELYRDDRPEGARRDRALELGWWPVAEMRVAVAEAGWVVERVFARLSRTS
jgi:hypothetical protein